MPIPKPGTQHHALGHGRVPTSGMFTFTHSGSSRPASSNGFPTIARNVSAPARHASASLSASQRVGKTRKESFKPRPSIDAMDVNLGASRWGGLGASVKEEEGEDY